MKAVSDTLGVARSNIAERVSNVRRPRGPQIRDGDLELAAEIRRLVDARPTYGYRRIAALLKRKRRSDGLPIVNAKRVYRLMKKYGFSSPGTLAGDGPSNTMGKSRRSAPTFVGAPTCWSSPAGTARRCASPSRSTVMIGR
jgi:transposase InsO family protein